MTTVGMPRVGSRCSVIAEYPSENGPRRFTLLGTVIGTVEVGRFFRLRTDNVYVGEVSLPLDRVVALAHEDGGPIEMIIVGSKGDRYLVRRDVNGVWTCTCKGFERWQKCYHAETAASRTGSP